MPLNERTDLSPLHAAEARQRPAEPETETLDKLYLEWSQFTTAKTGRELELERSLYQWRNFANYCRSCALSGESNPQDFDTFQAHITGSKTK